LNCVNPVGPPTPNGDPLSHRIRSGTPCKTKSLLIARRVTLMLCVRNSSALSPYRLYKSRTVRGSTRVPPAVQYHPLKSTVHTSWQCPASLTGPRNNTGPLRRRFRPRLNPHRLSHRLMVAVVGTPRSPNLRPIWWRSLRAPHVGWRPRRARSRRRHNALVL